MVYSQSTETFLAEDSKAEEQNALRKERIRNEEEELAAEADYQAQCEADAAASAAEAEAAAQDQARWEEQQGRDEEMAHQMGGPDGE